jgi:hypothetical protein
VTPATALVLLGFGVGALVVADRAVAPSGQLSLRARADALRAQASSAQDASARWSARARKLMDQWSAAEGAARKAGQ